MAEHKIDLKVELDTSKAKSDFDNLTNMMKNVKPIKIDIGDSVGNINKGNAASVNYPEKFKFNQR